jgi:8-oxo-dGTP pyrophosphatase MutT (NUDIX family)
VHRSQLLTLLTTYAEENPSEKACANQIKTFLGRYDTCFNRELSVGHMTGSAWIVNRLGTHTLLTHHKKLNKWLQPGGHADGDSDILQVAKREADEESGLTDLEIEDGKIFVVSDESHDLAWVGIAQLKDYNVDESVMRMARKWLQISA